MAEPHICAPIDANGNLTSESNRSLSWDAANRLVGLESGTLQTSIAQNGLGLGVRITVSDNSIVTTDEYKIECGLHLPCESRSVGSFDIGRQFELGFMAGTTANFEVADHLGSAAAVTTTAAAVNAAYQYAPFGEVVAGSGAARSYTGFRQLPNTQLMLARFRAYDPITARWSSEDPVGLFDGPNKYSYVHNNPTNYRDPLGLATVSGSAGVSTGLMTGIFGGSISGGGAFDSNGQLCGWFSVCARVGFGYFISAGAVVGLSGSAEPNSPGWSCTLGGGGDIGAGPGKGGQFGIGRRGGGFGKAKGGFVYGMGAGLELCCTKNVVCC
jgi:RHS repeat-associated protein